MKNILKSLYPILFSIFSLINCTNTPKISTYDFKSNKNVSTLNVSLPTGQIDICGWNENFIEITTTNYLYSLIGSDQNLIKFHSEEINNAFNLNIYIPDSLINAKIFLKIKIPFLLENINVSTNNATCQISDTFGNFNLTGKKSLINGDFKNSTVKINLVNGTINATFDMTSSSDVLLSNEQGETNINIIKMGENSFISANTFDGNINLVLSSTIPYFLISSASVPHILEFLTSSPKIFENNDYKLFINNTSREKPELQIFLNNQSGKTKINNAFFIDIN